MPGSLRQRLLSDGDDGPGAEIRARQGRGKHAESHLSSSRQERKATSKTSGEKLKKL